MLGLRQKLSLGFGGLLLVILIIGVQSIIQLTKLGHSIDVILRENYRSVIACLEMKEALERMDSGILSVFLGEKQKGSDLIRGNQAVFEKALQTELNNITLPGEGEKAGRLDDLFRQYKETLHAILAGEPSVNEQQELYFSKLLPLFSEIKMTADEILRMNQDNMSQANDRARSSAASARKQMYLLLLMGMIVAAGFVFFTGKWILRPIDRLIRSTEEIKSGNLDLVVQIDSKDEIGRLSESFNEMAESLRQVRRADRAKLVRIQDSTQHAFSSLPDAFAVIDPEGKVEVASESARNVFGLKPGVRVQSLSPEWLGTLYQDVLHSGRLAELGGKRKAIQYFDRGEERYFSPMAVPILDGEKQVTGVVMTLKDVTEGQHQNALKRGVISTVSHQLKTPLTSIRMAIHLLLEEKVGSLNTQQAELLVAAREDSDRLHNILMNLLDISRMESGKSEMNLRTISPYTLVFEALEPFQTDFRDRGVRLEMEIPEDLPEVWADTAQMNHVFANMLSNALRFTSPGGKVTVLAREENGGVQFSVSDTGKGIPEQYLGRIFEQFFRVPDQEAPKGAGLGLAIVKDIIEAHGGTVGVESRFGKGTTFTFTLMKADQPGKEKQLL